MRRPKIILALAAIILVSCQQIMKATPGPHHILAVESFLADITQNIAGDKFIVDALISPGIDPHSYQPSPQDVVKISNAKVLIINGANLEVFLSSILANVSEHQLMIVASAGLTPRVDPAGQTNEVDPHFWLDPNYVIKYAENIRDGLIQADPVGASTYNANTMKYISDLQNLDSWVRSEVQQIPPSRRLLITNHETFGYFADRYGFTIVGAIIPSVTSGAAPSAQELAALTTKIRSSGVPAIFLEAGTNPQIANQIASETGVKIISDLYTHSLSTSSGPAPTYIEMMKFDVNAIVNGLK